MQALLGRFKWSDAVGGHRVEIPAKNQAAEPRPRAVLISHSVQPCLPFVVRATLQLGAPAQIAAPLVFVTVCKAVPAGTTLDHMSATLGDGKWQ